METGKGRYGSKETCVGVLLLQPGDEGKLCSSLIMIYAHTRMHAHTSWSPPTFKERTGRRPDG